MFRQVALLKIMARRHKTKEVERLKNFKNISNTKEAEKKRHFFSRLPTHRPQIKEDDLFLAREAGKGRQGQAGRQSATVSEHHRNKQASPGQPRPSSLPRQVFVTMGVTQPVCSLSRSLSLCWGTPPCPKISPTMTGGGGVGKMRPCKACLL